MKCSPAHFDRKAICKKKKKLSYDEIKKLLDDSNICDLSVENDSEEEFCKSNTKLKTQISNQIRLSNQIGRGKMALSLYKKRYKNKEVHLKAYISFSNAIDCSSELEKGDGNIALSYNKENGLKALVDYSISTEDEVLL